MVASSLLRSRRVYGLVIVSTLAGLILSVCSPSVGQDLPPTVQRLLKKAQTVVAEVQRRVESGDVPQDVIDELQELDGLMQAKKHKDAETLLDRALVALDIDPETLKQTRQTQTSAKPETSSSSRPLPKFNPAGFTKIFDGATLDSWDGDPMYWKVEAGALLGEVTPDTLLNSNSWIVWRGDVVEDFELVLEYRVSCGGNSGIGYRLAEVQGEPFAVRGPQADIHGANMFTGICYEENGRRLLAARGQSTWIDDPGTSPRLISQMGDPEELQGVVHKERWNQYRLLVKGHDAQHFINGILMSEVHDHDETNRMKRGLIGVQVHVGPPMKIEFRDIYLKHLGDPPTGDASRGKVAYRSGHLLELEHAPSFQHFVEQTAKLTAPIEKEPVDGRAELTVVTRNLGIVRHDLTNVKLHGESKSELSGEQVYDLVVTTPDFTVRVPKAGFRLIGKPLDRDYRVSLRWNDNDKHYDLIGLESAKPASAQKPVTGEQFFRPSAPKVLREEVAGALPNWADNVQTFIMLPTRPKRARELHASVNGAWAGIPGRYSILPNDPSIQQEYNRDQRSFADAVRDAGLVVTASINTIEGFHALREDVPDLDDMACRNADGELVMGGEEMTLMCSINPNWVRWEIETGKKAIDDGADWILLDTPMGASFISGFLKAGFCDHCAANFQAYLRRKYSDAELRQRFGVETLDRRDMSHRLTAMQTVAPMQESPHVKDTPDALLFQEFAKCQEETNFATRQYLMTTLHQYAKDRDKAVLFCTNAADLGTQNSGGHWIRGLQFADLVDLFTYELSNDPHGRFGAHQSKMPRGKWAAFHKLAYAVHHRRSAALINVQDLQVLIKQAQADKSSLTWMATQTVEAYAANGAYVPFHVEADFLGDLLRKGVWGRVLDHNRFIQQHKELYHGKLVSGSPVAFLFLLNERGRTIPAVFPSYLGLAQGFVEGNYPFDVVFAGDGRYVKDRLDVSQLKSYATIIVPSPIDPTENQKRVVQAFAKAGGVVVCQEPSRLGLSPERDTKADDSRAWLASEFRYGEGLVRVLEGDVTLTETHDVGTRFFRDYTPELRSQVARMAEDLGLSSILRDHHDGLLSAFPVLQSDRRRLVVHLVNYDVDYGSDVIRPKKDVDLMLLTPSFLGGKLNATLYGCDEEHATELDIRHDEKAIRCTIPEVGLGAVVVISDNS
jgi:3-keto-disaccharide hydrolase